MQLRIVGIALALGVGAAACATGRGDRLRPAATTAQAGTDGCAARDGAVRWLPAPAADRVVLDRWCRGVGTPLVLPAAEPAGTPNLADLTVVSWNARLGEGRLADLVADLRAGSLTGGRPVHHFVVLVQELFRRGVDIPDLSGDARSAAAIGAPADAADARALAHTLGLAIVYVPSMRNGPERREDRGNGIVSSERLVDPFALELPFERQRRVAIGATIEVLTPHGIEALRVMNVHLDPVSASGALWFFRNPRPRQMAAVLDALQTAPVALPSAGTVLGGDLNTIQSGAAETASRQARAWSTSLAGDDPRPTHRMGKLDYLFFRLSAAWQAVSHRASRRFGSDHYPVIGRFSGRSGGGE
jgi:endonuclease/exonuclease/phosphatase family metal-dependent hydrolase